MSFRRFDFETVNSLIIMLSMRVGEPGENQGSLDGKGPSCNRVQREFNSRSVKLFFLLRTPILSQ